MYYGWICTILVLIQLDIPIECVALFCMILIDEWRIPWWTIVKNTLMNKS